MPKRTTIVSCQHCSKSWSKRIDTLKHWRGACLPCYRRIKDELGTKTKDRVPVSCKVCGKTWRKREDSISEWNGYCHSCAQRIEKSRPELIARIATLARAQVLRQGGVPNARKFRKGEKIGPLNNLWKGGITPIHRMIRTCSEYKAWRKAVFQRDDYTCQHCGERGGRLNADHIKRFSDHPELRFAVDNGRTLCDPCHRKTPTYGKQSKHISPS